MDKDDVKRALRSFKIPPDPPKLILDLWHLCRAMPGGSNAIELLEFSMVYNYRTEVWTLGWRCNNCHETLNPKQEAHNAPQTD